MTTVYQPQSNPLYPSANTMHKPHSTATASPFMPPSTSHFNTNLAAGSVTAMPGVGAYSTQTYSHPSLMHQQSMTTTDGQQRRRVRSVILNEEVIGPSPEETVRYVEVPYVEEVVRHVPRKEIVEVEKRVKKFEYEWIDKIVEVPQIQYIDKTVEVPQVHDVVKHVPRREVIEVPKEIIRHVPKIETKIVEKVVEVPGEIIEVPKPYPVETKVAVPHYVDQDVPMVVAQTLKPVLTESEHYIDVDVIEYEPEVIPVDIHVPKAVQTELISVGVIDEQHRVVQVPPAQYNSMLRMLNPHILEQEAGNLPFLRGVGGGVPFLDPTSKFSHPAPLTGVEILGWQQQIHKQSSTPSVRGRGASTVVSKHRGADTSMITTEHIHQSSTAYHAGGYHHGGAFHGHIEGQKIAERGHRDVSARSGRGSMTRSHSKRARGGTSSTMTSSTTVRSVTEKKMSTKGGKKAKGVCPC